MNHSRVLGGIQKNINVLCGIFMQTMVKSIKKLLAYGFLIWLIPFLVSFLIFPIREDNRLLFESIMPVVLTTVVIVFSVLYFNKMETNFVREGIIVGITWMAISIIIDLFMFLPESQWHMSLLDYMIDIGLTYMIILLIPIGFGGLIEKRT